jgi:hypothetical protein
MILYVMYENAMSILKLVRLSQVDQRTSRVDCSCVQCSMDQGASLEGLLGLQGTACRAVSPRSPYERRTSSEQAR